MSARLHAHAGYVAGSARALCGHFGVLTTDDPGVVSCQLCLRRLREALAQAQAVAVQAQADAGGHLYVGDRLRTLREGVEGLASIIAGDWGGRRSAPLRRATRWTSIGHALAEMVARDMDGPASSSMSDPDRMERMAGRLGGAGTRTITREESDSQDLHAVRQAYRLAFGGWDPEPLTLREARAATLLRYVGGQDTQGDRRPWRPSEIADHMAAEHGREVTPRAVGRATRRAAQAIYEHLRTRELVPERKPYITAREQADMTLGGYDYTGWKEIAAALGVSEPTAKRWRERDAHPLPVHQIGGLMRARANELLAWLEEEAERNRRAS